MKRDPLEVIREALPCEELLEEIGDVTNALVALGYDRSMDRVRASLGMAEKMHRWADRLEEASK